MSYRATVGASAANSNLIEFKKIIFTPVLNKSYVHCDFSKWFINYLKKNANEFKLFVCCCWYLEFTSVDLLPFKIKIFDRLTCISTVMLYIFNLQLGGCKYKIYNMTNVNLVIYTHPEKQHNTTFNCISIIVDTLFFVYLYMAREGIEKLFNITDRSYNALN